MEAGSRLVRERERATRGTTHQPVARGPDDRVARCTSLLDRMDKGGRQIEELPSERRQVDQLIGLSTGALTPDVDAGRGVCASRPLEWRGGPYSPRCDPTVDWKGHTCNEGSPWRQQVGDRVSHFLRRPESLDQIPRKERSLGVCPVLGGNRGEV